MSVSFYTKTLKHEVSANIHVRKSNIVKKHAHNNVMEYLQIYSR